jgi:hypothetical protein
METSVLRELSKKYCPRFGKIAVDMKFVTTEQLKEALAEQAEDSLSKKPHRLLGNIFFKNGWMTGEQIDTALNKLSKKNILIGA